MSVHVNFHVHTKLDTTQGRQFPRKLRVDSEVVVSPTRTYALCRLTFGEQVVNLFLDDLNDLATLATDLTTLEMAMREALETREGTAVNE